MDLLDGIDTIHGYDQVAIDARHRQMLAACAVACRAAHVMEIGCANGYSTAAWIWLLDHGFIQRLSLCDVFFTPGVRQLCGARPNVTFYERPSVEALADIAGAVPDFLFVDGLHTTENVAAEVPLIERLGVPNVTAHDVSYWRSDQPGFRYDPGARQFWWQLSTRPGWYALMDAYFRPNEETQRGIMFASSRPENYAACQPVFRANGPAFNWREVVPRPWD